jgi:hypothetical protein
MALFRLNEIKLPGDVWTNPSDQPESYGTCGQNIDNIKSDVTNILVHTLWLFAHHIPRHNNKI